MDHQSELEKIKYRNWVRGGLAYKYLKDGIESFVDDIVKQEHSRILREIKHTTGLTCNRCTIQTLKPLHKSEKDPVTAGKDICPKGQVRCNCLFRKKEKCRNNICDAIFEEILNSHGSTPPAPNWKNSNIQNWCSFPWEIAKCFINSPGYSDKVSASDTDVAGLLHILINNLNLHEHFSVNINENDVFSEAIEGRNTIFHSPAMELEDHKVNKYIDNIIAILEDEKELKSKEDSKQAVVKLKQLRDRGFVITTHDEVEVCRDAMASINNSSRELNQMIHEAKNDIDEKQTKALKAFDDKSEKALADALDKLDQRSESQQQVMKQAIELLNEKIKQLELDTNDVKERLTQIEQKVDRLDEIRNIHHKHLKYLEQKQVFQGKLVTLYEKHYVKTWISPFKVQDKYVNIDEVYVMPNMIVKKEPDDKIGTSSTKKNNDKKQVQSVGIGMDSNTTTSRKCTENTRAIHNYQDIFQTYGITHKKIYITGEFGTGKTSLGKMMISNWCKAWKALKDENENVEQMQKFDFLFFIPLQRMSGFSYDIKDMIETVYKDFASKELIEKIVEQDGERCLIIADGLDEWTPPKTTVLPHHVSLGIPNGDGMRNATFITLSRSSAKGILNMKSSEFDQKIMLLGLKPDSKKEYIRKYMSKLNKKEVTFLYDFMQKVEKSPLQHLERAPFLLQQLIWMHCNGNRIGQSISDIFSNIFNIIFNWFESKNEEQKTKEIETEDDTTKTPEEFKRMQLPTMLRRFPRCQTNKRLILLLSKFSFGVLTNDIIRSTFARSELLKFGIENADISMFLKLGILVEYNSFDPTYENTYLSFVHISYLEFLAAVYISSHCTEQLHLGETILEKLFINFKSANDILQSSNLLHMVCGLSPFFTGEISKRISKIVKEDECMIEYRKNLHKVEYRHFHFLRNEPVQRASQIQKLMRSCLFECGSDVPTKISLCDILITNDSDVALIEKCAPDKVISLAIIMEKLPTVNDSLKGIAQFSQLQYLCFRGTFSYNSEELMALVNVNVRNLCLINRSWFYSSPDPTLQIFNLSKYSQLQNIHLENVWCTLGPGVKNLKSLHFSRITGSIIDHVVKEQFQSSLTQTVKKAVFLRHLTLYNYNANEILDLSKLTKLQSIHLTGYACTLGSDVTNLENIYISVTYLHNATHGICEQLLPFLAKAVSLKQLHLEGKWCNDSTYEGHTIDLSGHVQLQTIHLKGYFCTFGSDLKNLETVYISRSYIAVKHISHEFCEQLSSALGKAVSLKQLYLQNIECNDAACEGHSIDLSGLVQLQNINFYECTFILNNAQGAKNLETFGDIYRWSEWGNDHRLKGLLLQSLSHAVSLKHLKLDYSHFCNGLTLDLSKFDQLQSIELKGHILVPGISTKSLRKVEVEGFFVVEKLIYLCSGSNLKELEIRGKLEYLKRIEYEIFTSGTNSRIQNLEHLESLKLIKLDIDDANALTVSPRMQHISEIILRDVIMSLDAWRKFVDSLLTLKQSVDVYYEMSFRTERDTTFMQTALEYVKKNAPVIKVKNESSDWFYLRKHRLSEV